MDTNEGLWLFAAIVVAGFIGLTAGIEAFNVLKLRINLRRFRSKPSKHFYIKTIHGYTACRLVTAHTNELYVKILMGRYRSYFRMVPRSGIYPDWYVHNQKFETIVHRIPDDVDTE